MNDAATEIPVDYWGIGALCGTVSQDWQCSRELDMILLGPFYDGTAEREKDIRDLNLQQPHIQRISMKFISI